MSLNLFVSAISSLLISAYGLLARIPTEAVADSRAGGGTDKMRLEHIVVPRSKAMLKRRCPKDTELNMKDTPVARSRKNCKTVIVVTNSINIIKMHDFLPK